MLWLKDEGLQNYIPECALGLFRRFSAQDHLLNFAALLKLQTNLNKGNFGSGRVVMACHMTIFIIQFFFNFWLSIFLKFSEVNICSKSSDQV